MIKILTLILALTLCGCTENTRTAKFGGEQNIALPANQKLAGCTWKITESSTDLWYLSRPMRSNEVAETWTFQERSGFGMLEGKVIFQEVKK